MTVTHALTPAPRGGSSAVSEMPAAISATHAADVLRVAEALADEHADSGHPCERSTECERTGVIAVVTEDDTTLLCGIHAMTAVFTTPGLLALVKPAGM